VLNQYSMSEFEGNFRIATHQNADWRAGTENLSSNNVFILDKNLNKTGEIRNIAKGENIKSVRFMGKRGFVVTFKSVDPLFVIDMNPSNPKIVGELKIPGWSDYLHPIDENYIIGFGKEVNAESANKERLTWDMLMGMKLAIFDVSDLKNPKEIHKIIIGDRGTTSEILHNPRALFYDAQRQLIGFPVQINKNSTQENGYETSKTVFSGAHIYKFSVESGFSKLGEVSHFPSSAFNTQNFWDQNYKISRIVRIGENFYSSSKGLITGLSSTMTPEKTVSFMGTKNCSEISDANTCEASQLCKATYTMPKCPEGQFCIQMMQFDKCVLK
ncbi:TPA: hypothetical protein EYP45_02925, partial [Candidatus Peregrinibacteria bacterium]|nr:hypothetical protein [Candidatus Peregrinibacteria bacterium]